MIHDREPINARTVVVVTDRDQGIVHGVRVIIQSVPEEGMNDDVNTQLIAAMRRLAQSPREGGPDRGSTLVNASVFQAELREYLEAYRRTESAGIRGEWTVEVPIRIYRLWETEERDPVQANVIERIHIDERRAPVPPPGVIDSMYERIDEVLDELQEECGGEDPMSRLIRRWRNGHLTGEQARYIDRNVAQQYARMSDAMPATVVTQALDIRELFRQRLTTETGLPLRVEALRQLVPNSINAANQFIADNERIMACGGQVQPMFVPDRIHDLKHFVEDQRSMMGSVYHELEVNAGPCRWQWIDYYDLLEDRPECFAPPQR